MDRAPTDQKQLDRRPQLHVTQKKWVQAHLSRAGGRFLGCLECVSHVRMYFYSALLCTDHVSRQAEVF